LTNQGIQIMKTLIYLTLAAGSIALPALSFAQSSVTRAQVNAELEQLVRAGYDPSAGENVHYPDDILAAEARIAQQGGMRTTVGAAPNDKAMSADSVGGVASGSGESGSRATADR
jgi:hypothetical protein